MAGRLRSLIRRRFWASGLALGSVAILCSSMYWCGAVSARQPLRWAECSTERSSAVRRRCLPPPPPAPPTHSSSPPFLSHAPHKIEFKRSPPHLGLQRRTSSRISVAPLSVEPSDRPPAQMSTLSPPRAPGQSSYASARQSQLAGSGRTRGDKFLIYAAHSGFGNQELSLRRAVLLAFILNRTLVLPPLLRQHELSFGPPEQRCANASWQAFMQRRAEEIYRSRLVDDTFVRSSASATSAVEIVGDGRRGHLSNFSGNSSHGAAAGRVYHSETSRAGAVDVPGARGSGGAQYESLRDVFDLSVIHTSGVRVVDFRDLSPHVARDASSGRAAGPALLKGWLS